MLRKFSFMLVLMTLTSFAAEDEVKYKSPQKINFEALLIEGENKKPDLSVVTGNLGEKDLGLVKLRPDFVENMADDFEEEIQ